MDRTALYHRLPGAGREALASLHGWRLIRARYGRDAEERVAAALAREEWDLDRWADRTSERLAEMLRHAATAVPWYRQHWEQRRAKGDRSSVEDLSAWPILAKESVRAQPRAFLADGAGAGPLIEEHTSGTSGTPLTLWWDREATHEWFALLEARLRRWHGVSRHEPWAIIGGQLVVPPDQDRPPWWVRNRPMRQLYVASTHISARSAERIAEAIEAHGATHVLGYPSGLHALASHLPDGRRVGGIQVALSNAEPLLAHQRRSVAEAFAAPVRDTYGQAEIVAAGSECPAGRLHEWPEAGVLEVLDDDDQPAPPGTAGRLVATGLLNRAMPLVRYEVGDRLTRPEGATPCPCGRTLPGLGRIEGRSDDVVRTVDGREVGRLDPVFKADLPIREAQIRQTAPDRFTILVVPGAGFSDRHAADLRDRLCDRVGPAEVRVERVPALPRDANGKLKAVVVEPAARSGS